MKILDFVINVEQAEQDLYRRLAECSRNREIRSIFQMVASKEGVLLRKLQQLKEDPTSRSLEIAQEPQIKSPYRQQRADSCELLDEYEIRNDLTSYNYILRTEKLVFNLYSNLKEREQNPDAQALLNQILDEKQLEIDRIHTLYDVAKVLH